MRERNEDDYTPVPPMRLPCGTPGQLSCMDAAHEGLRHLSRRDLERLVKAVAEEVNKTQGA